jgi:hypothetical protein
MRQKYTVLLPQPHDDTRLPPQAAQPAGNEQAVPPPSVPPT